MPMSRAEAICACNNIVELVEQMDDKLPDTFSSSIDDKVKSMLDYILKTPQYPKVTEKMDQALRNMWGGLQKWNRNGDFNDNLFDGIEAIVNDLKGVQAAYDGTASEESSNDTDDSGAIPLGLEEMSGEAVERSVAEEMAHLQAQSLRSAGTQTGRIQGDGPNEANKPKSQAPLAPRQSGLSVEQIVKIRENAISTVLNQLHEKHITVVDTKGVRHGIMQDILKLTKSDRTTQLIHAAFYAGKISGIMQLGEDLSTEAGKK